MKKEYSSVPDSMKNMFTYGFSWMEFVTAIPSPLFVVTSYKSNGKPNACLQSWRTFTGGEHGYYAILSAVSKQGHLYGTLHERGEAVLNFMSADIYNKCIATVSNNDFDRDEITDSGLTVEKATFVNAPQIRECFMNLECHYMWEKEIVPDDDHVIVCMQIVNISIDEEKLDEAAQGRYGDNGFLYNIHHPINPENFGGTACDWIGKIEKIKKIAEY